MPFELYPHQSDRRSQGLQDYRETNDDRKVSYVQIIFKGLTERPSDFPHAVPLEKLIVPLIESYSQRQTYDRCKILFPMIAASLRDPRYMGLRMLRRVTGAAVRSKIIIAPSRWTNKS